MDGLFGLPRKKSAETSQRKSLHGHLYFKDQGDVDQFVIFLLVVLCVVLFASSHWMRLQYLDIHVDTNFQDNPST